MEGISTGLIAMRRRKAGRNWFHMEEAPNPLPDDFGVLVARLFAQRDFLESVPTDEGLLAARLKVAPEIQLVTQCRWTAEGWKVTSSELRHPANPCYAGNMDARSVDLLARCDGPPVREILTETAARLQVPMERLVAATLPMIRTLIERGFLAAE